MWRADDAALAWPVPALAIVSLQSQAVHDKPQQAWILERLAHTADISRTAFATRFRAVMDQTPGDYIYRLRMALARDRLAHGQGSKKISATVG